MLKVTNKFAIEWMRRHLGDTYKIHEVSFEDDHCPVHIDECLTLICPGLVNTFVSVALSLYHFTVCLHSQIT